ncbi:SDR family NAD(P)-dependent oxidoreductase [Aminobacter aminovorans]|uniref:3alpha(Or 20beta)-hydroxysteroid dehydrogenase n=1 Tax=Aminobacter aminovorans TaxID=83263 RepID=A0AAC8YW04_AMIAI|nr:SDR family oxidoreductase [Aminobacter aminovorans]AMS45522.1 hypothetical protein AA2016_6632 [Aminobacter aminovorans]MBB3708597.1 3alpha(or 20beta)-hydroxysteroid dehydrogenase [Aminobacter aminovorans]
MTGRLETKVAIVTGGASGLGEGIVRRFAREGARVVIADVDETKGQEIASDLGGQVLFLKTDVTDEGSWNSAIDKVGSEFSGLDILVNCAGSANPIQRIDQEPRAAFERVMELNVTGVWLGIKAAVPLMRAQQSGSIINIGSIASFNAVSGQASYATSKFAVLGLTRSAALEYGHMGIRVNSIHPGVVHTPLLDALPKRLTDDLSATIAKQPIKRFGTPDEIALATLFFASDDSSYCTGSSLVVDGGHIAGRHRDLTD